jgi:hypothetical protein
MEDFILRIGDVGSDSLVIDSQKLRKSDQQFQRLTLALETPF